MLLLLLLLLLLRRRPARWCSSRVVGSRHSCCARGHLRVRSRPARALHRCDLSIVGTSSR